MAAAAATFLVPSALAGAATVASHAIVAMVTTRLGRHSHDVVAISITAAAVTPPQGPRHDFSRTAPLRPHRHAPPRPVPSASPRSDWSCPVLPRQLRV